MRQAKTAEFRFYEELNDFLPKNKRRQTFPYHFGGHPTVKDAIEAMGVPHTEVDLVLANGESVRFDYHLKSDDRLAVYPVFESMDISPINHLREEPLRQTKFIIDVHLGKLARMLRMLGFDCLYRNDYEDEELIHIALKDKRIILTRDLFILKHKIVTHGYWIRNHEPEKQIDEVLKRFDLYTQIKPFYRCMLCNGKLEFIDKSSIESQLPPKTKEYFDEFFQCSGCDKIYWKGSHYEKMKDFIRDLMRENSYTSSPL